MRTSHLTTVLATAAVLGLGAAACGADGSSPTSSGGPSLTLSDSNIAGGTVEGNVAVLDLEVAGIDIVGADGDTSGETGHLHLFVDGEPVPIGETIPKQPGIIHTTDTLVEVFGLSVGSHEITAVLGDGEHRRIHADATASWTFDVAGPSVRVRPPTDVVSGEPVVLEVEVQGVDLVGADGDTSGGSGHLHVFIDRDPKQVVGLGNPIPKEAGIVHTTDTTIELDGLAPGEHTIWVILGDGEHATSWPAPVGDRVVATVT